MDPTDVFRWLATEHNAIRVTRMPPYINDTLEYLIMTVADLAAKLDALITGDSTAYDAEIAALKQKAATIEANDEAAMATLEADVTALDAKVQAGLAADAPAPAVPAAPAPTPPVTDPAPAAAAPVDVAPGAPVEAAPAPTPAADPATPAGTLGAAVETGPAPDVTA